MTNEPSDQSSNDMSDESIDQITDQMLDHLVDQLEAQAAENKIGLSALTFPMSGDEFVQEAWPEQPFVSHDLAETVESLVKLPFLTSLDSMLEHWRGTVQVHLPDVKDESSAIDANTSDARKLYANGMALLFNNVQALSPVLQEWLDALSNDLGLPNSTYGRCMVYATPDGKGTAPHFDQNVNFVLQLHGTKTWWLAPNDSVDYPTQRHTMGQPLDPELASYAHAGMPSEMPSDSLEVVLKPGSMLFVPRGFWHRTEAESEALALNFTFSQPTWIDIMTLALRSRLSLSPNWRSLADGVRSNDESRRLAARERFDQLILELVEDLPHWCAEDILGATEGI